MKNLQQLIELQRLNARPVRRPFGSHSQRKRRMNVWGWLTVALLAMFAGISGTVLWIVFVGARGLPL